MLTRLLLLTLLSLAALPGRADSLHCLWELHGKHNTVYLLGSIHVLRPSDYPLAPAVLAAYAAAQTVLMEIDLADTPVEQLQSEMLSAATLPEDKTLPQILGAQRYARAGSLAHEVGVDLSLFDRFAPWFAAEAISELQLGELGFKPESGVDLYFLERAKADGKRVAGLETVHDQIAIFQSMSADAQAEYLMTSLEQAHELPKEVGDMVRAWEHGDTDWFAHELQADAGHDPALYRSLLAARNRKWVPQIEALLNADRNVLVIVGTGHLAGRDSVLDLLNKDGIVAIQR